MQASISENTRHSHLRRLVQLPLFLLFIALLASCTREENAITGYPRLNTLEVSDISKNSIVIKAAIISGNPTDIIEYGFVWSKTDEFSLNGNEKQSWEGSPGDMKFGDTIQAYFTNNTDYNIRAYAKTDQKVIYGNTVTFHSPGNNIPVLTGFSPQSATWGDTLRITGMNFGYSTKDVTVVMGEVTTEWLTVNAVKADVLSVSDESIDIVIPEIRNKEKVKITVIINYTHKAASEALFTYLTPVLTSVSPKNVSYMDTLSIHGENFSRDVSINQVAFNGYTVQSVYASRNLLKVIVPSTLSSTEIRVNVISPVINENTQDLYIFIKQ